MVITQPLTSTFALEPGHILTVSADDVSSGLVVRLGDAVGSAGQGTTAVDAGETQKFGPFGTASRFQVVPTTGSLSASTAPLNPKELEIDRGEIEITTDDYAGSSSFQPIWADLNLAAGAGTSEEGDSSYLAAMMGNVFGSALTKVHNMIGAVIGKLSVGGDRATTYPLAAVIGEIGEDSEHADAAVMAVIGGDGGAVNADAAFAIDHLNSNSGAGFNWVVNGHKEAHDGYNAGTPLKGFARVTVNAGGLPVGIYFGTATNDAGIVSQVGADNTIADGSLYISHVDNAGKLFQKQNDVWVDLQA